MIPLTDKQYQVFQFILAFLDENSKCPTAKEIAKNFGFSNTRAVNYIKDLVIAGRLEPMVHTIGVGFIAPVWRWNNGPVILKKKFFTRDKGEDVPNLKQLKEDNWDGGCSDEFMVETLKTLERMYGKRKYPYTIEQLGKMGGAAVGGFEHSYRCLPLPDALPEKVATMTSNPEQNKG